MQVLIVDDSRLTLMTLKSLLTTAGYDVLTALNGQEALQVIREKGCRLVITDWEMPIMDGIELCRAVRADSSVSYVYLVLLTGHGKLEEMVQGLSAGADDFIAKPYQPSEVIARIRSGERILSLETRDMAIFALAKLAESRDTDTGAHLERVQHYCRTIAQELATHVKYQNALDGEFVRLVFQTSPLHDIGKVGIPDYILLKPGKLDAEEYEIMKSHTTIAGHTLDATLEKYPNASFLIMARDIAIAHHEKFNGKGYPFGLKEEQIPLCARIVAIADVYDALTSKRVYKDALMHDVAKSIICRDAGEHFDPEIVNAFLAREEEIIQIHKRFAENNA